MNGDSPARIGAAARRAWLGHGGAVLWLTGLPAAGKTTLATALEQRLLAQQVLAATVDGDRLRTGLSRDLGFSDADRRENIRRAGELGFALAEAGAVAIVALISPFRAERDAIAARAEEMGTPFAEIFVNAPLAICEQRDPKGLYRRARAGELANLTGVGAPYESPQAPALELHTDVESVAQSLEKLVALALRLADRVRT